MSFPFNTSIPAGTNNPSLDRPTMQQNNGSTNDILAVDHITFNNTRGGQHQQITLANNQTPSSVTNPTSIIYSAPGTGSLNSQLFYKNSDIVVPISPIKAFGRYTVAAGVATAVQSFNVATVSKVSTGVFMVTLSAGAVQATNTGSQYKYTVLATPGQLVYFVNYSIDASTGTFNLTFNASGGGLLDPVDFSFQVLQV